jgi:hypothetical protein
MEILNQQRTLPSFNTKVPDHDNMACHMIKWACSHDARLGIGVNMTWV